MEKKTILCCAGVFIIFAIIGFILIVSDDTTTTTDNILEQSIFYDSKGKISPKSSDLTLYYNNDASIYGYYVNDVFQGIAYYDDADIKGNILIDLSKVKWSKKYNPSESSNSNYKYTNNVSHAKKNFVKDIQKDYDNGDLDVYANLIFKKENGKSVKDLHTLSKGSGMKVSIKDGILKIKVKHKFNTNHTIISNDIPYEGALSEKQSDFDKTSKAYLTLIFEGDDYRYEVTSTLNGDNFNIVHT